MIIEIKEAKGMVDKIFKIGLLVVLLIFLVLYSQKDRYTTHWNSSILDTHTGKIYSMRGDHYFDPVGVRSVPDRPPIVLKPQAVPTPVEEDIFDRYIRERSSIIPTQ